MNRCNILLTVLLWGVLSMAFVSKTKPLQQTLIIEADQFDNNTGVAVAYLFRKQDDIPEKPFIKIQSHILNNKANLAFEDIPYGEYAVIVFHDENSNGVLDHKMGFPSEGKGFSNEWKFSLFSGMPTFDKLKFEFTKTQTLHRIRVQ